MSSLILDNSYKRFNTETNFKPKEIFNNSSLTLTKHFKARDISLAEGDLPKIPHEHTTLISDYLSGKATISSLKITKENYKEFLTSIKVIDLEYDRESASRKGRRSTYELRTTCLEASEGELHTFEAYTKSIKIDNYKNPFAPISRAYAMQEENYVPERIRLHALATQNYSINALQLSRRCKTASPTIYALRGNTAAGKSTKAKLDVNFQKSLDINGEATGALNPDTVKGMLRKNVRGITNDQMHIEGAALAKKLRAELLQKASGNSFVIDERLEKADLLNSLITTSKEHNGTVVVKDIDAPLMLSCLRVLTRDIGQDPCVTLGPITAGYKEIRQHRKGVIELVKNDPTITQYDLFVATADGASKLACQKQGNTFTILENELMQLATQDDVDAEISNVGKTVITKELIAHYESFGLKVAALDDYIGLTVEKALLNHSKKSPQGKQCDYTPEAHIMMQVSQEDQQQILAEVRSGLAHFTKTV